MNTAQNNNQPLACGFNIHLVKVKEKERQLIEKQTREFLRKRKRIELLPSFRQTEEPPVNKMFSAKGKIGAKAGQAARRSYK